MADGIDIMSGDGLDQARFGRDAEPLRPAPQSVQAADSGASGGAFTTTRASLERLKFIVNREALVLSACLEAAQAVYGPPPVQFEPYSIERGPKYEMGVVMFAIELYKHARREWVEDRRAAPDEASGGACGA